MSAIAALRSATWPSHQRLEKRLDVKARFTRLHAYRAHLERMWGFCAAVEHPLRTESFGGLLPDYESRRKLPLLTEDLLALGAGADFVASLPRCAAWLDSPDPAAAFGCVYVLEGATLGGRTLLPLVESRLGLTSGHGAAFLSSYGDEVTGMWRGFGHALDAWCCTAQRQSSAEQAAVATFDALDGWLCGAPS
jgi:heme oxygenase (biliverdin-IX-beta and delta-forming)